MRLVIVAVGAYFLALVAFFVLGLGKISWLMFHDISGESVKDGIEVASWLATIVIGVVSLVLSLKAYSDAERSKKLVDAKDVLFEVKNHFFTLEEVASKRWEIVNSFSRFESRMSYLGYEHRRDLENQLCTFCNTLLVKIRPHHIFPFGAGGYPKEGVNIFEVSNGNCIPFEGDEAFQDTCKALARCLLERNMVTKLGEEFFVKDADSSYPVLMKIIEYAQPGLYQDLSKKIDAGSPLDMNLLSLSIKNIPAAIIFLNKTCKGRDLFKEIATK
jgi:hypothetical protein